MNLQKKANRRVWRVLVSLSLPLVFSSLAIVAPVMAREVSITPAQAWFSNQSGHSQTTVTVWYDDEGQSTPAMRGFHIEILYPSAYAHVASIQEGGFLSGVSSSVAFFSEAESGRITVNAAILGSTSGATGSGGLFTVTFNGQGVSGGCDDLEFDEVACVLRDVQNEDLAASYVDGWIAHDVSGPGQPNLSSSTHPEGQTTPASLVQVQWSAVGDLPPGCAAGVDGYYLIANQSASTVPSPSLYSLYVAAGSPTTGSFTLSDGTGYYVHIAAYDEVGNPSAADHYGPFAIDTTPPGNVSGFQAVTGHNRIALSWTPPGDASYVRIYRKAWSYPEFDDAMARPQPPAFAGDGVLVGQYPVATTQTNDVFTDLQRNYYVYTAFAFDAAGNPSAQPAPASAQDWALSYWLGDFDNDYSYDCTLGGYDGYVDGADLNALSAVFGLLSGEPGYCAEMDIGPTSDNLETGYPETDNEIGFEDMMVFSLTFGGVAPRVRPAGGGAAGSGEPVFALRLEGEAGVSGIEAGDDDAVTLALTLGSNPGVKGLRALVDFDARGLEFVGASAGDLLAGDAGVFLAARPGERHVEIDLARLGAGLAIEGEGDLARLRFRVLGSDGDAPPVAPMLREVEARGARNQPLGARIEIPDAPQPVDAPALLTFRGAEPNPIRATARFVFGLPAAAPVTLELLDVSGRRVRVLAEGVAGPGLHRPEWDGRDAMGAWAPSGVYLARLRAGSRTITRQVLVVR